MPDPVSPALVAASLAELWSPRVVAELDDSYVKVANSSSERAPGTPATRSPPRPAVLRISCGRSGWTVRRSRGFDSN